MTIDDESTRDISMKSDNDGNMGRHARKRLRNCLPQLKAGGAAMQIAYMRKKPRRKAFKRLAVGTALAGSLLFSAAPPTIADTFTEITGAGNPFDSVDVGDRSTPAFVDIDGDGDFDAFFGEKYGSIKYYKNTGTASLPTFTEVTGTDNPLDVNVGDNSTPAFVDIDDDGDFDAFIGEYWGGKGSNLNINFYRNDGSDTSPNFTEVTGTNPFNGEDVGNASTPAFVDIDGDGDSDAFIGNEDGYIKFYRNDGSATTPNFTEQTGTDNPFDGEDVGGYSTPAFVDIDGDGDSDAFIGEEDGGIIFYRNDGSDTSPTFNKVTPIDVNVGYNSTPAFVDIDGDGDSDAFIGDVYGYINHYKNDSHPTVSTPIADVTVNASAADKTFSVFPNFADAEDADTALAYTVTGNTNPAAVTPSAIVSADGNLTLAFGDVGSSEITVQAEDTAGQTVTDTFTVAVNDPPPPVASVMSVTSTAAAGPHYVGSVITITIPFSYLVWVKGTPSLALNTGGPVPGHAYYTGGSGTKIITFEYTVASGDDITVLDYWSQWALELNGGQIYNNGGIDADLSLPAPGEPGSLSGDIALSLETDYPVYRLYCQLTRKHLFTMDENEKDFLIALTDADGVAVWRDEGIAYNAFHPNQYKAASRQQRIALQAVHRFYSEALQTHLFTMDENEKETLIAESADVWRYEGPAFYVPASEQDGAVPVYRFYSESLLVHLFTADENEKNHLIDTAGDVWNFEGTAYYVYP
ncbi:FG-GAP-like repeat-containing protein [Desulfococcaceae bacterium HSG7]|nr:FG-GAP-like repeat-containing protein [Desulfococcaceae bacterium HSG7]